ncbi:MAG: GAF domain-containing SpoIIE family protein phosphatase [Planctomycetaceae bacterium]|nr:GAF domain-containing SpoIIE family protein phosphatase [Planctomycetaceae bacterium]
MLPAPIPANEAERLAELQALSILDTPSEERFDAIVRLAQQLFEVPVAYIALIDSNRQWFKAKCGVTVDETGREESFCGHAILENRLMIVPDARLDHRFDDNPLVVGEPYVRFYAGHPLSGPRGFNIGTLCLVDREPRTLNDRQQALLKSLAEMAEEQLHLVELVAMQRELLETQAQLLQTQQRLAGELREAEDYVRSLLPAPLIAGPVRTDWTYVSSSQLGGDLFGYHWLDDRRFAFYLLDVCGHGVGASLLASSVHAALRRQSLPDCDFTDPAQVLAALDVTFPMDEHHNKFFTIWYGVFDRGTRELRCSAAGHHPAFVFSTDDPAVQRVGPRGLMIGVSSGREAEVESLALPPGTRLALFSDGAFEIRQARGGMLGLDGLSVILREVGDVVESQTAEVYSRLSQWTQGEPFVDDFSLVQFVFV